MRTASINPVAPYGYVKDPCDRHHLMIDSEAANVVKRIFCMVAEGNSTAKVAQVLNAEHPHAISNQGRYFQRTRELVGRKLLEPENGFLDYT